MTHVPYYRETLQRDFSRRVRGNANYSMRSFARSLGMDPGSLSQVLSGKRTISKKVAYRILSKLELSDSERLQFLQSIVDEKEALGNLRIPRGLIQAARPAEISEESGLRGELLESARFAVISEWYHYAILEMTNSPGFKLNPKWIAERLGITPLEAKLAIDRILSLKLIEVVGNRWQKREMIVDTKDKSKTSQFHQKRVRQILEKSLHSLENDPLEVRNHVATTLCVDPSRISEAKARVQKFLWELTEFLGGEKPERVYELSIQFFPLEKAIENSPARRSRRLEK